jgi:superfamily I DNA/RNA helicase
MSTKKTSPFAAKIKAATTTPSNVPSHLMVIARAGTGKTTTLVEGLKHLKGIPTKITPSTQQAAIWEQLKLSADAKTICFVAFNKGIAEELKQRVPVGCEAMTMHSMGLKACTAAFPYLRGKGGIDQYRVERLIEQELHADIRDLRRNKPVTINATKQLVDLVRATLSETDAGSLQELCYIYNIETNDSRDEIFSLVPRIVAACKDVARTGSIDFTDMVWLPVVLNLPMFRYDLLLVDEAQDLNRCQQALAKKAGRRLILCGDPKQAIYGFAGADCESMDRIGKELEDCVTLPLTVTRRCGKAVVTEAKKLVSDFEAHESNGEGEILRMAYPAKATPLGVPEVTWEKSYGPTVRDGDMIVCRTNAPLVSQCFSFIKRGKKAVILGRDVGRGLTSLINKFNVTDIPTLTEKLSTWAEKEREKETTKKTPSESRLMAIDDKVDCILAFTEGADTVAQVIAKIDTVFTDDKDIKGIRLSSIHKSKGLEADTVYLLRPKGAECPHPMAKTPWAIEQEYNLLYVAITRAIKKLVFVS